MFRFATIALCVTLLVLSINLKAQGFMFGDFFGGGSNRHEHRRRAPHPHDPLIQKENSDERLLHNWAQEMEIPCPQGEYLCDSLVCVSKPMDCPCKYSEQIKCITGQNSFVCVSDDKACQKIKKLSAPIDK